jgi:hypothetical protein
MINPDLPTHKLTWKWKFPNGEPWVFHLFFRIFIYPPPVSSNKAGEISEIPDSSRLDAAFAAAATADARRDEMWRPSLGYTKNRCGISVSILAAIKASIEFGVFLDLPASQCLRTPEVDVESGKPMVFRLETDLEIMGK